MRVTLRGVSKAFRGSHGLVQALRDVSLVVEPREFLTIVGPSGCGKSTLLNLVAGLEVPDAGDVSVNGDRVREPGPDRVLVFQDHALFPWLSVLGNVEFGLRMQGRRRQECRATALHYLHLVHLTRFQHAAIHELSGGMKQRVALARALALSPRVLLMDEPFSSLDAQTRDILHVELEALWQKTGATVLFVTHNVREAAFLADRVVVLSARPGRVLDEVLVTLARPRHKTDPALATLAARIMSRMREDVERAAREELDSDWHLPPDDLRTPPAFGLGGGI